MTTNTKNHININKANEDKVNTQMATGQKISKPSDDPVIAIRALRLNTNLSQLNQFYDKNIPDAQAWMKITETALKQTDSIFDHVKENLTTGASDTCTADDRMKILENLKGLRSEVYSSGNADYAGRTVFTGYRTGEPLSFLSTDTDLNCNYKIHQNLSGDDVERITYITTGEKESEITTNDVYRVRLPYDVLNETDGDTLTIKAPSEDIDVTVKSIKGMAQPDIDNVYTTIGDDDAYLIPETGELILGKNVYEKMKNVTADSPATFEYNKNSWQPSELRPEHYFACVKTEGMPPKDIYYNYDKEDSDGKPLTNPADYVPNFKDEKIEVEISFNQKIEINTNADEVYTHDIGRDIDDLLKATQDVIDVETKLAQLKLDMTAAKTDTDKQAIQVKIDAANKEFAYKKDKMQKMFSEGLDRFDGYADRNNLAVANIGNMSSRLKITRERVADQLQSFTELADENINITLTDTAIDLSNAELALQAAQMAAAKIAQQTLLNYL